MSLTSIKQIHKKYFLSETKTINHLGKGAKHEDTLAFFLPITVCSTSYDFTSDSICKDKKDLKTLVSKAVLTSLSNGIHIESPLDNDFYEHMKPQVDNLLLYLKQHKVDTLKFFIPKDHHKHRYGILPVLEWNMTSPDFNLRNGYYNNGTYSWSWTRVRAFLFIFDLTDGSIKYFNYQSMIKGDDYSPDPTMINKLFKRCSRNLSKTIRSQK